MGKGLLRIIGRMLGICVLLAALIYGVQWAEQLPIATNSSLTRELLGGLLWILMGFLLPFLTAQKRERLAFSLESAICCVLCFLLAAGIFQFSWLLPLFLRNQVDLLQRLLFLVGGMFFHRTLFRIRS